MPEVRDWWRVWAPYLRHIEDRHLRPLVNAFVVGWVDLETKDGWETVQSTAWLDERLDGDNDGALWWDLLYRQVAHCLGPTTAAAATGDGSPLTAPT